MIQIVWMRGLAGFLTNKSHASKTSTTMKAYLKRAEF